MSRYTAADIEQKWQAAWEQAGVFTAKRDETKPKYYVLEMFPYPSGRIHMGHVRNYTMGDVVARFKMSTGHNVLHPMGWDAFGMPAENAAMASGGHPKDWTYKNIADMRGQIKPLGLSIDWSREFATCEPEYYGQQQALFIDMLDKGLVYRKNAVVNWDPVDMTVLDPPNGHGLPRTVLFHLRLFQHHLGVLPFHCQCSFLGLGHRRCHVVLRVSPSCLL